MAYINDENLNAMIKAALIKIVDNTYVDMRPRIERIVPELVFKLSNNN